MSTPKTKLYPETLAGGFSSVDGTVQFYTRIKALLSADARVLDLGAGRGAAFHDDGIPYRKSLRELQGHCAEVIGCDVDPVVLTNPSLDRAFLIDQAGHLDLEDNSVDLILCDFVLEHIPDPQGFATEVGRVLKPGGWFCARTPNKWGYIAMSSRIIPERLHDFVLRLVQPNRKKEDTFPTNYKINTMADLRQHFPDAAWLNCSYGWNAEPAYFGNSLLAWRIAKTIQHLLPAAMTSTLMIFLQKKART